MGSFLKTKREGRKIILRFLSRHAGVLTVVSLMLLTIAIYNTYGLTGVLITSGSMFLLGMTLLVIGVMTEDDREWY